MRVVCVIFTVDDVRFHNITNKRRAVNIVIDIANKVEIFDDNIAHNRVFNRSKKPDALSVIHLNGAVNARDCVSVAVEYRVFEGIVVNANRLPRLGA